MSKKKAAFWTKIRYSVTRFNEFMKKVPIIGIPWRIGEAWRMRGEIFDMSLGYADQVTEKVDDVAEKVRKKVRKR